MKKSFFTNNVINNKNETQNIQNVKNES